MAAAAIVAGVGARPVWIAEEERFPLRLGSELGNSRMRREGGEGEAWLDSITAVIKQQLEGDYNSLTADRVVFGLGKCKF